MNRLRVAGVGAGYFSQFNLRAWRAIPEVERLAWCDREPAKAQAYLNPLEMLEQEKPDLLDIVTPPDSHLELVRAAAERRGGRCRLHRVRVRSRSERPVRRQPLERSSRGQSAPHARRDVARGLGGSAAVDGDARLWWKPHRRDEVEHRYDRGPDDEFGGGACRALQLHVVDHLLRGNAAENPGRAYLRNLEIEEAIYRSSAAGRRITIPV